MNNFCIQAFPLEHYDAERLDWTIAYREVSNIEQVETFIRDFFRRRGGIRAKKALHAMIVFFGHGSEEGFCLVQKQHMALDQITLLTKDEWRRAILKQPEELPVMMEIIFSQCYGHLHSQAVQTDRFRVIALTTPDYPLTTSTEYTAGSFVNDDLEVHSAGTLRQQVNKMEVWRLSDGDGFVDLGQRSEDINENSPTTEDSVTHRDVHQLIIIICLLIKFDIRHRFLVDLIFSFLLAVFVVEMNYRYLSLLICVIRVCVENLPIYRDLASRKRFKDIFKNLGQATEWV